MLQCVSCGHWWLFRPDKTPPYNQISLSFFPSSSFSRVPFTPDDPPIIKCHQRLNFSPSHYVYPLFASHQFGLCNRAIRFGDSYECFAGEFAALPKCREHQSLRLWSFWSSNGVRWVLGPPHISSFYSLFSSISFLPLFIYFILQENFILFFSLFFSSFSCFQKKNYDIIGIDDPIVDTE